MVDDEGVPVGELSREETNTNAKLIAAAPDLLEALQGLMNELELTGLKKHMLIEGNGRNKELAAAQDAINKALEE